MQSERERIKKTWMPFLEFFPFYVSLTLQISCMPCTFYSMYSKNTYTVENTTVTLCVYVPTVSSLKFTRTYGK